MNSRKIAGASEHGISVFKYVDDPEIDLGFGGYGIIAFDHCSLYG